jgi:hypothetical protein
LVQPGWRVIPLLIAFLILCWRFWHTLPLSGWCVPSSRPAVRFCPPAGPFSSLPLTKILGQVVRDAGSENHAGQPPVYQYVLDVCRQPINRKKQPTNISATRP